jgi:hypothetical protein
MTTERHYADDPIAPAVVTGKPTTGPLSSGGWVAARRDERAEIMPAAPQWMQAAPLVAANVDEAWKTPETVAEIGSPANRAWSTVIRGLPLLVLAMPAAWGLAWATGSGWGLGLLFFAGLAVAAYLGIVLLDLQHNSPTSVERHRINQAARLKELELRQNHQLRRAIVESYLDRMEGKDHDGGH